MGSYTSPEFGYTATGFLGSSAHLSDQGRQKVRRRAIDTDGRHLWEYVHGRGADSDRCAVTDGAFAVAAEADPTQGAIKFSNNFSHCLRFRISREQFHSKNIRARFQQKLHAPPMKIHQFLL